VARLLIVGAGSCRALALTRELVAEGHAVRGVTRGGSREAIEAAGGEAWIGDPDRIGTLRYALENVTLVLWLLGHVATPELHGSRLEMMLEKSIDTTARGVIYERGAAAPPAGAELVEAMASYNEIPFRIVSSEAELRPAVDELLAS
jgi:UDP:flavonoid glycosyltransferase YjiC (YdhE family)